MLQSETTIMIC